MGPLFSFAFPARLFPQPPGCQDFVDELVDELRSVVTWNYGKVKIAQERKEKKFPRFSFCQCELYHWIDVLNRFDDILERACRVGDAPSSDDDDETKCVNLCTNLDDEKVVEKIDRHFGFSFFSLRRNGLCFKCSSSPLCLSNIRTRDTCTAPWR